MYQALYRKYRSQTFSDLVGQEATSRALQGTIASDRVAHAYLFSGTRGTGKTTSARLLAKAINCSGRAPGTAEPCNRCESCLAVGNGSALDLIEIDAASNRGIDEIRDLREKVNLAPALGGRKVYIIDEAHMLTTDAFNALLKTLEEPPAHVVFILCTTEVNKVPPTVLGRCQHFVFRRHSDEQIVLRLIHIAEREQLVVEPDALRLIARVAQGSMRDGVGLLDQLVPLAGGPITLDLARELLGIADPSQLEALLGLVLTGQAGAALAALARIYEAGGELRQVVRGLMERSRDLIVQAIDRRDSAARDRLATILDALLHLDGEVRRHAEPRFLVEATLVRLAVGTASLPPLAAPVSEALAVVVPVAVAPAAVAPAAPAPVSVAPDVPAPVALAPDAPRPVAPVAPVSVAPAPADPDRDVPAGPAPVPPPSAVPVSAVPRPAFASPAAAPARAVVTPAPAPDAEPVPVATAPGPPAGPADPPLEGWRRVLDGLKPQLRAYFREARPELEGSTLVLSFPYGFHHRMASENEAAITPLVREWLGASARVDFRLEEASATVGAAATSARPPAPEEDEVVQAAVRQLEGRVTRVRETR